ncbi:alpha-ketoglutarate-dependent dioxygenase AlkB family protein [Thalassotalea ganghwensis]
MREIVIKVAVKEANIEYFPHYIPSAESDDYLTLLQQEIAWRQDQLQMFGKMVNIPRLQAWYADQDLSYQYSNLTLNPEPWIPVLVDLRHKVSQFCQHAFNSVLINYYRDHQDSVGWHSDDEPELGSDPIIASLSFGATRDFSLKHKSSGERVKIALQSGSLLVMRDKSQLNYQHALPKSRIQKGPRINLTFRQIMR